MTESHLKTQFEPKSTPAVERTASFALLLDIDGVVTDPIEKKMTDEFKDKNLTQIETLLNTGNVVTLNTGRSNEWMIERVINPLRDKLQDKSALANFFAVGEKGLTWASFDNDGNIIEGVFDRQGKPVEGFDLSVFLEPETVEHFQTLAEKAKELIDNDYSHSTFFDGTKKAMVSTEMKDGHDHKQFEQEQKEFTCVFIKSSMSWVSQASSRLIPQQLQQIYKFLRQASISEQRELLTGWLLKGLNPSTILLSETAPLTLKWQMS